MLHPCWCKNTSSQKRAKRGTCLHRFSLLSYLSSQSLKNFSWGACSSSGFSLHKSTNCLSKESWKLSNFEAIFASKSVTPSLRLLSWVKKLSHDPLRVACNFVYVCTTLPFGKTFEIRHCNKSFFGATQGEPSHSATLHHLAFYCLSNSKVAWIADINSSPFSLGRKQCVGSLWAISRKYTVGATDEQMSKTCFTVSLSKGVSVSFTVINKRTNKNFNIGHKKVDHNFFLAKKLVRPSWLALSRNWGLRRSTVAQ